MPIELIDKLEPANKGTFALVDAKDVAVDDKARLSDALITATEALNATNKRVQKLEEDVSAIDLTADKVTYGESTVAEALEEIDNTLSNLEDIVEGIELSAEKVTYQNSNVKTALDNTTIELQTIRDLLEAVPVLDYDEDTTNNLAPGEDASHTSTVSLGNSITLPFYTSTRSIGDIKVTVQRAPYGSDNFETILRTPMPAGNNVITVEKATQLGDFIYKLQVTDSQNKPAKYEYVQDGISKESNYLLYRRICGDVQFSSTFSKTSLNTSFSTETKSLVYPFTFNYGVSGYRYLYYTLLKKEDSINTATWKHVFLNNSELIPGGKEISSSIELDVSNFTIEDGSYWLYVKGGVSSSPNVISDTDPRSSEIKDTIEVLPDNSIVTTLLNNDDTIESHTYFKIEFVPRTNVADLLTYRALSATVEILDDNGDSSYTMEGIRCTHGNLVTYGFTPDIINLPSSEEGTKYTLKVTCKPSSGSGNVSCIPATLTLIVKKYAGAGDSYSTNGLLFSFEADQGLSDNKWIARNTEDYSMLISNAQRVETSDGDTTTQALHFTTASYAALLNRDNTLYNPWAQMIDTQSNILGCTVEMYMRSECIGNLAAKVLSTRVGEGTSPGVNIAFNEARIDSLKTTAKTPLLENTWQHVVLVYNTDINTNSQVVDLNPYNTLRIYVNGVLVKAMYIPPDSDNAYTDTLYPVIINGSVESTISQLLGKDDISKEVKDQGDCYVKTFRWYIRGLTSSEVYNNFLNCIPTSRRNDVIARNEDDLVKVYFTKNKEPSNLAQEYYKNKGLTNKDFSELNLISDKATSKKSLVNCTMHYYDGKHDWVHEEDVDVYLQGTSSLEYPVKNYKIKVYTEDKGKRVAKLIRPPYVSTERWPTADYVYTLKCDYMEQSHRNNTPTACYFQDKVLDKVIEELNPTTKAEDIVRLYSPARQEKEVIVEGANPVSIYRDAIDGLACIVYYNNNSGDDQNDIGEDKIYVPTEAFDICVGSYMFNIDKEGAQLGFNLPTNCDAVNNAISYGDTSLVDYSKISEHNYQVSATIIPENASEEQTFTFNISMLPCVSYEGGTNDNISAGAFIPYEEEHKETMRNLYKSTYIDEYDSFEEFYTAVNDGESSITDTSGNPVPTREEYYKDEWDNSDDIPRRKKYTYFEGTLEPRYTYVDSIEDEIDNLLNLTDRDKQEIKDYLTYNPLETTIRWVYDNKDNPEKFKAEFSNYFSFEYCMTYFLQMHAFTQVDNAGKNAMFDTWGGRIYPRPYDMDTQMGLDNSGQDIRTPCSELNISLSPAKFKGSKVSTAVIGKPSTEVPTWETSTSTSHERFNSYNTNESVLWKTFGTVFKSEIVSTYTALRRDVYTVDQICNYVDNITCNVIGETYYNIDAVNKYLGNKIELTDKQEEEQQGTMVGGYNTTYLRCIQGARQNRYRQFLQERLIFLDTYFDNLASAYNSSMEIRTNAEQLSAPVGIHVYSPQYVRIQVDAGKQLDAVIFMSPDDKYTLPDTEETYEGTLVYIPTTGSDKNIKIRGVGNVEKINHTEKLDLSKFDCSTAVKLTDVELAGASKLNELILGSNVYIRELDISSTHSLKSSIDVSACSNLEIINAANSAISGLSLPQNSPLHTLDLRNSMITTLTLENCFNLSDFNNGRGLNLDGCDALRTIVIKNCPNITQLDVKNLKSLTRIEIEGTGITSLDLSGLNLTTVNLADTNITSVNFQGCSGSAFENLNLTNLPNLTSVNLSQVRVDNTVTNLGKVMFYVDDEESLRPNFTTLNLSSSLIGTVKTTQTEGSDLDNTYDFTGIHFKDTTSQVLNLSDITSVKYVTNLRFKGNLVSLFDGDVNLISLNDCVFESTTNSIDSIFRSCSSFCSTNNVEWTLSNVTSARRALQHCHKVNMPVIKGLLSKLTNVEDLSYFLHDSYNYDKGSLIGTEGYPELLSNVLNNNKYVTKLDSAFRDTRFKYIDGELFKECSNIENLRACFMGCLNLTFVGDTLLTELRGLTNCDHTFAICYELGETSEYNNQFNFFTRSFKVFSETNNVTTIAGMFYMCNKLNIPENLKEDSETLKTFFDYLSNCTDASECFRGVSKLHNFPKGVLSGLSSVKTINGIFADTCKEDDGTLPETIFGNSHSQLVNAKGIFACCKNLNGTVSANFFTPSSLKDIGAGMSSNFDTVPRYVLGTFANTKISSVSEKFLQKLVNLESCSLLFYHNDTASTNSNNPPFPKNDPEHNISIEIQDISGGNRIRREMFKNCTKLKNISYFMPSNMSIEYIEYDVFHIAADNKCCLENISGAFMNCSNAKIVDLGTSDTGDINNLFNNDTISRFDLKNITNLFANCSSISGELTDSMFNKCNFLENCKGVFLGTSITGNIPVRLFNSCRNTLTNVSYMFANCKQLNGYIECGYALINDPDTISEKYNYDNFLISICEDAELNIKVSAPELLEQWHSTYYTDGTLDIDKLKANEPWNDELFSSYFDGSYKTEEEYLNAQTYIDIIQPGLLSECNNLVNVEYMFAGCENLCGRIPPDMFYFKTPNKKITSLSGLFDCCHKLTLNDVYNSNSVSTFGESVIGYKESSGSTEIKRYTPGGGGNYLFVYPTYIKITYDADASDIITMPDSQFDDLAQPYQFIPQDWLAGVPSVQTFYRTFYGVGTLVELKETAFWILTEPTDMTPFTYSKLALPSSCFNYCNRITKMEKTFAWSVSLGRTSLDKSFLSSSLNTLTSIDGIFLGARLYSLGTQGNVAFEGKSSNTALRNIYRAFYGVNTLTYSKNSFQENDYAEDVFKGLDKNSYCPEFYNNNKFKNIDSSRLQTFYGTLVSPYYNADENINTSINSNYTADDPGYHLGQLHDVFSLNYSGNFTI